MLAFKRNVGRAAETERGDPGALANEEASLECLEAGLSTKLAEIGRREELSARALEEERQELVALTRSPASTLASNALARFPASTLSQHGPLSERLKANEARLAALRARKTAVDAEEQAIARREQALANSEQTLLILKKSIAQIRAKALEIAEADKTAVQQRAQAATSPLPARAATGVAPPKVAPPKVDPTKATFPHTRHHKRVKLQTEVSLSSESNFYSGFGQDLSDGGIFVATCNILEAGTQVDLSFTLPGEIPVVATGIVRWSREFNEATPEFFPGMGVEFVDMAIEHRQIIHAFTTQRDPLFWVG